MLGTASLIVTIVGRFYQAKIYCCRERRYSPLLSGGEVGEAEDLTCNLIAKRVEQELIPGILG